MKKFLVFILVFLMSLQFSFAQDKYSKEYLQSHRHFAIINPIVEKAVEHQIRKALKKQTGANYKIRFTGYTLESMKKGIFKTFELIGKNTVVENIPIPHTHIISITDYNYIDYTQNPIVFKSDMKFSYELLLSEDSLNAALEKTDYYKTLERINKMAFPVFKIYSVTTKIENNRVYLMIQYNFPIAPASKNKMLITSSDFRANDGKISAMNVGLDGSSGKIPLHKAANLINILNPIGYTIDLFNTKKCNFNIENVNIVDNKIKINGKIFIKGD